MAVTYTWDDTTSTVTLSGTGTVTLNALYGQDTAVHVEAKQHLLYGPYTSPGLAATLDDPVRPLDSMSTALKVKFETITVDGIVTIDGTDANNVAITEDVDSSGRGAADPWTATTTLKFQAVTNIVDDGVLTADVSIRQNRWGIVGRNPGYAIDLNMYTVQGGIIVETGVTLSWITACLLLIRLPDGEGLPPVYNLRVNSGGVATLGSLQDATGKLATAGMLINVVSGAATTNTVYNNGGTINFYAVNMKGAIIRSDSGATTRIWCAHMNNTIIYGTGYDIFQSQWTAPSYFVDCNMYDFAGTINKAYLTKVAGAIIRIDDNLTADVTISNCYSRWHSKVCIVNIISGNFDKNVYFIDADFDTWTHTFYAAWTGKEYRQYTFDLVTEPNATVTLKDNTGTVVFSVIADAVTGAIAQQTVSRGYYNQANGNTLQDYGPHTLTITKEGKQTYTWTGNIDEKIDWRITLLEPTGGIPIHYLKDRQKEEELLEASLMTNAVLLAQKLKE